MKKISVDYFLYFILVFLSIFIDSYFSTWFGYFGRPVLSIFLPVLMIIVIFLGMKLTIDRTAKVLLQLLAFLTVINLAVDLVYLLVTGNNVAGSDNVFLKSLNSVIQYLYLPTYYVLIYSLMNRVPKRLVAKPFIATFYFLLVVLIVELITMPEAWPIFHYNESSVFGAKFYERVRLTTTESSLTVPLVITYGTITVWHYIAGHKRWMSFISIAALVCFIVTSTSRTFIIFFIIAILFLIISYLVKRKTRKGYIIAVSVLAVFPLIVFAGGLVVYIEILTKSLGSLATRTSSLISAIIHMFKYPFGMGGSVSVLTMQNVEKGVVDWLSSHSLSASWSYWEVNQYLNDPERLTTYGILNYGLHWGIVGLFVLYKELIKIFRTYRGSINYSTVLGAVFWGYLGIMTLTIPITNCFSFVAFLAFINMLTKNTNDVVLAQA